MIHYQFTFKPISESQKELFIALLDEMGFTGFEEGPVVLDAFIPGDKFDDSLFRGVMDKTGIIPLLSEVPEQNWNAEWEAGFEPVIICNPVSDKPFVYLRAIFHPQNDDAPIDLVITPKMSFGTGHHPTTSLMIEQMSLLDFNDKKVLDFGTGTGVLAILAEKLGASTIYAIDNDDWSILNATENIAANNCTKIIVEKRESPSQQSDIILANINRNIITANLAALVLCCNIGGKILFSGILVTDKDFITKEFNKHNIEVLNYMQKDNWLCIITVRDK
ncbi:MAG TPA: 50S ribosomal protein L11 methyltransferase [Ferruginibacter sp.]|nr:50S ribosomal protein L11 methyltransferase [Ferruginibacter sp.]